MWKKWLRNSWKRWLIITTCLGLVVVRLIWPHIQFDAIAIWLVAIAVICLLIPDPRTFFPYIKRVKLWEAEIELKEEVKELGKEVEKVQESVANKPGEVSKSLSPDIEEIFRETSKDPRAALLLLSTKIEHQAKKQLQEAGLKEGSRNISAPQAIKIGVEAGIFPQEIFSPFQDFWAVRNRVVHAEAFDVEDSTILSLVELGTELLKMVSTVRNFDPDSK